jgi:predicted lysophospholipase L1 biosynthesis ABC-type transport system permease subunit
VVVDRTVLNVGNVGAPVFSVRPIAGASSTPIQFTLISGHAPHGRGEAAIGPATAKDLHVEVGDTVSVGPRHDRVKVVGEALFPSDVHSEFDEGLWLAPRQFDAVVPPIGPQALNADDRAVAVQFLPGLSAQKGAAHLQSALGSLITDIEPPLPPPEVLAAFLGLIAIAALASVLLSCARRRSHEFAVLRSLGMTRGNIRAVLLSQGTVIGLFGLAVGIPLGIAIGRVGWHAIAARVPLSDVPPFALVATLLIIPSILLAANILALWPGQVAVSRKPAEQLRVE